MSTAIIMRTALIYLCSLLAAGTNPTAAIDMRTPAEVTVFEDGTGILNCSFKSGEGVSSFATVAWTFRPTGSESAQYVVLFYTNGKSFPSAQYKKRVMFSGDLSKKDASIRLEKVQFSDAGTYFCDVKNPPDIDGTPARTELRVTLGASQRTHGNCSADVHTDLFSMLETALECREDLLPQWSSEQAAKMLLLMKNLTDSIQQQQQKACHQSSQCPVPVVPDNGGLACVTVGGYRYCKPMCNKGFDFSFLRRSRLYERCGADTGFSWQSQFIGGNRLADCIESSIQVAGAATAYFPQDCLTTQSSNDSTIQTFIAELKEQGVNGPTSHGCLTCA